MDSDTIMRTLLDQARVSLAQGRPSHALQLVLAAVRHQRGEEGVFEVLNQTREAHGLKRLAVPSEVYRTQLPSGSSHTAPRIRNNQSHHPAYHSQQQLEGGMEDEMEDEGTGAGSGELDPAEAVETMFRTLSMSSNNTPAAAAAASHAHHPSPFATPAVHAHHSPFAPTAGSPHPSSSPFPHAASPFSASPSPPPHPHSQFHPAQPPPSDGSGLSSPSSIRYPSLRTVLPSLSSSAAPGHGPMLEEMHSSDMYSAQQDGGGEYPSDAATSSAPLLSLTGREALLDLAYDDNNNVICPQCAALIPKHRFQAHVQFWCQS